MKTSVLITGKIKQIMLTPENDSEKEALSYINPGDEIHTVIKKGSFYSGDEELFGVDIYECQGGYYRAQDNRESIMFIVKPKEETHE